MATKRPRLLYVDNLRTLLIIMVILWHMAVTYGASGFWPYQEGQGDDLTVLVFMLFSAINNPYVLGFFFMIAGYFTPGAYDRKGPGPFLKARLIRLGIPLLLYVFLIDPLIYYAIRVSQWGSSVSLGSYWQFWKQHVGNYRLYGPGVGPMWFVELMLIFVVAYGLGRLLAGLISDSARNTNRFSGIGVPSNLAIGIFAFCLGVVIFAMRIWLPVNSFFKPLGLPMAYVPQYIALFLVGVIAYRGDWFQRISVATGKLWLAIVLVLILVLFPILFVLAGALEGNTDAVVGGLTWQSFAFSVWEEFICVSMIIVLLVWFREKLDRQNALAKTMSDSVFAVYFIHAPVLVFLALALKDITLYPLLKFALVAPIAVVLCFAIAYLLRKLPLVRRIL
ncbi:MAG: acyltransferase family protein [Anaerolineae bacterium]|jgi:surface polysaccharide O-acyltransferase-like enzyme